MKARGIFLVIGLMVLGSYHWSYGAFPIGHKIATVVEQNASKKIISAPPEARKKPHNRASTSAILGAVGIVASPIGVICSILAIVFGAQEINGPNRKTATVGLILGIVGVMFFLITALFFIFSITALKLFFL